MGPGNQIDQVAGDRGTSAFIAPRWLANAHIQTLGAALPLWAPPRSLRPARTERALFPLPETWGALSAHVWWQCGPGRRPCALVLHGVGGSSESRYALRAAAAFYRVGCHVVRLNMRGAGDSLPHAPSLYHAGLTADPKTAVSYLARDPRVSSVTVVGFSVGGNTALKLAAEWSSRAPAALAGVVSVSAPLHLASASCAMEKAAALPYRLYVLRSLVNRAQRFAQLHPTRAFYSLKALGRVRTIRDYDELVIAPMHGFRSALEYYDRASAGPELSHISIPTLVIHAEDDPMVPAAVVRPYLSHLGASCRVAWSARGGHIGWFAGMRERHWVGTWALEQAIAFLRTHARS